jgi:hypothetical protein
VSGVLKWRTARDRAAFSFFAERGFAANRGFVTRRFNTTDTPLFSDAEKAKRRFVDRSRYSSIGHVVHPAFFCHEFFCGFRGSQFPGSFAVQKMFKNVARALRFVAHGARVPRFNNPRECDVRDV